MPGLEKPELDDQILNAVRSRLDAIARMSGPPPKIEAVGPADGKSAEDDVALAG